MVDAGDEAVNQQLAEWVLWADRVDDAWIARARTIYRESRNTRGSRPRREGPVIDTGAPLWLGQYEPYDEPLPTAAAAAVKRLVNHYGPRALVWTWILSDGDEEVVLPGHNVVMVRKSLLREPIATAIVSQPARVFHVVRETRTDDPVAVLVADPDAPTYRYRQIKEAITKVGAEVDWENTLSADAAAAVYAIWRSAEP